jgi:hypothetical protein
MARDKNTKSNGTHSGLNFEVRLWAVADKMRGHMDAENHDAYRKTTKGVTNATWRK